MVGKAGKLKENRNRSTTSIVTLSEGERVTKFEILYPRIKVCAPFVGLRATGKVDASSKTWFSNMGTAALAVLVPAERLRKYYPCRNIVCERYQHDKDNDFQYFYPAIAFADYGAVSSQISEVLKSILKSSLQKMNVKTPSIVHRTSNGVCCIEESSKAFGSRAEDGKSF